MSRWFASREPAEVHRRRVVFWPPCSQCNRWPRCKRGRARRRALQELCKPLPPSSTKLCSTLPACPKTITGAALSPATPEAHSPPDHFFSRGMARPSAAESASHNLTPPRECSRLAKGYRRLRGPMFASPKRMRWATRARAHTDHKTAHAECRLRHKVQIRHVKGLAQSARTR